jgi:hypothetical protein
MSIVDLLQWIFMLGTNINLRDTQIGMREDNEILSSFPSQIKSLVRSSSPHPKKLI